MKAMQAQQPPQYGLPPMASTEMGDWPPPQAQQPQAPPQQGGGMSGVRGLIPNMLNRGLQAAGPIQQPPAPPPRPQRPSMQELMAQQPPMQNPWAGQRQVQQQGNMAPPPRPDFARTQVPQWMQARPSAQPQVPQGQGRQQMMAQMLRRRGR